MVFLYPDESGKTLDDQVPKHYLMKELRSVSEINEVCSVDARSINGNGLSIPISLALHES